MTWRPNERKRTASTKDIRNEIEKTNTIAEALKEDPENVTLLSQMWVYLTILVTDSLLDDYAKLVRFKIETTSKILERKINNTEIDKDVSKSIRILRDWCEAYQRFCYEFDKKCSEIKEKSKHLSV